MTEVAILGRGQMPGTLAGQWQQLAVMTAFATTGNSQMNRVQKCGVGETTGIGVNVTYAAILTRRDMVHFLAQGDPTIMTGGAVVRDARVTKRRGNKGIGAEMTDGAILGRRQMTGRLAYTDLVVVAGRAITHNVGMIKHRLGKIRIRGVMTRHAVFLGRYMINWLAVTDHIVMACHAVISNASVIKGTRGKRTPCGVAINAIVGLLNRHVIVIHAKRSKPIVTGVTTSARHFTTGVVYESTNETFGIMAVPAICGCNHMILYLCFTACVNIIMTGFASQWRDVEDRVIEYPAKIETAGIVADNAIGIIRCRVVLCLTNSIGTVMTADTVIFDTTVVK